MRYAALSLLLALAGCGAQMQSAMTEVHCRRESGIPPYPLLGAVGLIGYAIQASTPEYAEWKAKVRACAAAESGKQAGR